MIKFIKGKLYKIDTFHNGVLSQLEEPTYPFTGMFLGGEQIKQEYFFRFLSSEKVFKINSKRFREYDLTANEVTQRT